MKQIIISAVIVTVLSGCRASLPWEPQHIIAMGLITVILLLFWALGAYSNIFRDEISNCDEFNANAQKLQQVQKAKVTDKGPFSLTKVQFGLWTAIIASSYTYLSFFKGDCGDAAINKTALVLMGIFAGTAVATKVIDNREMNDNRPRHQNRPSHGFFIDIISDDNGISLHRVQNFVWTLIAASVYLYKLSEVKTGCILPELNDTLLTLTGISSATYVVLRANENNPAVIEAQKSTSNP